MQLNRLGNSGIFTADLTLGTMTFGDDRDKGTSEKEAIDIIHRYLDAGGNHLDTADVYNAGESERIIAKALKGGKRNDVILATKANFAAQDGFNNKGTSRYNLIQSVQGSLQRLDTDYIDLLYVHAWDRYTPIEETLHALHTLVEHGHVRYIGFSNFMAWQAMKALGIQRERHYVPFVAAQLQYNLLVRDVEYEHTELCQSEGVTLLPWGPLGGGFLTGKYKRDQEPESGRISDHPDHTEEAWHRRNTDRNWRILDEVKAIAEAHKATPAQVSLAWLRHKDVVGSVVIGARTMEQLEGNLKAAELTLTDDDMQRLDKVSAPAERYPSRFLEVYGRSV